MCWIAFIPACAHRWSPRLGPISKEVSLASKINGFPKRVCRIISLIVVGSRWRLRFPLMEKQAFKQEVTKWKWLSFLRPLLKKSQVCVGCHLALPRRYPYSSLYFIRTFQGSILGARLLTTNLANKAWVWRKGSMRPRPLSSINRMKALHLTGGATLILVRPKVLDDLPMDEVAIAWW